MSMAVQQCSEKARDSIGTNNHAVKTMLT